MYLMTFPKAAIPIKTGIFHVFVLARNRLITLLGNLGTLFKKYRFQSNLLKKIYLLLKNKLFVKKMLFDFYCIGKASFRNNCFYTKFNIIYLYMEEQQLQPKSVKKTYRIVATFELDVAKQSAVKKQSGTQ